MVLGELIVSIRLRIFIMIRGVMVWVSVVLRVDYLREVFRIG